MHNHLVMAVLVCAQLLVVVLVGDGGAAHVGTPLLCPFAELRQPSRVRVTKGIDHLSKEEEEGGGGANNT